MFGEWMGDNKIILKNINDKLSCKNKSCKYNNNDNCTILTQSQVFNGRIICEERKR